MTTDYELKRIENERLEKRWNAEMALDCAPLENLLDNPNPYRPASERHAEILDCLFYTVMRRTLKRAKANRYFDEDRVTMALRIQKHAADIEKSASAINYMNGILTRPYAPPTPRIGQHTSVLADLAGSTLHSFSDAGAALDKPEVIADT